MKPSLWRDAIRRISPPIPLSALVLSLAALALPAPGQTRQSAVIQATQEIGVSFAPSLIAYREYQNDGVLDSEHGWIAGVEVNAAWMHKTPILSNLLLQGAYEFNDGSSKHWSKSLTGSGTLSYAAPFRSNDAQFAIGKVFTPNPRLLCVPELEAEYREWLRQLPQAGLAIRENYTFWAPGLAVSASYNPFKTLVLKARGGVAHTVFPANATIGNPSGQVPDFTFALGNRPVWQADLGADWAMARSLHAVAGIDYSHFGFGNSAPSYYGNGKDEYEPSSITDHARVHAGLAWAF
jgi:hypothetical protein